MKKLATLNEEEDKAYALLEFLVGLVDSQGAFTNNKEESVRVSDHIYVVGGAVRNFVIGMPVKDIDIVIDAIALSTKRKKRDAVWLADLIERQAPYSADIVRDSNKYGVEILHVHGDWIINGANMAGQDIEIAFARKESYTSGNYTPDEVEHATIEEDAVRREFTFNTLLWSFSDLNDHGPSEEIIKDPLGTGLKDLKNNVIDTPKSPEQTFEDDASRMMRALKFQHKYGFDIAPRVQEAIQKSSIHIRNVPSEVLYVLLTTTILNQPNYKQALEEMKQNGLLKELILAMEDTPSFRTSIKNWVEENRDIAYLFNVLDYDVPIGDKLSFLSEEEQGVLRGNVLSMPSSEQYDYLSLVKNIGPAIGDKSFFMEAFSEAKEVAGLSMSDIPFFRMRYYEASAREVALQDPQTIRDSDSLKGKIMERIRFKLKGEGLVAESSKRLGGKLSALARFFEKNMDEKNMRKIGSLMRGVFDINRKSASLNIEVPSLSGDIHVFDLDDTLFWSPEWHTMIETDESGSAIGVSMAFPNLFHRAMDFVKDVNQSAIMLLRKDKNGLEQPDLQREFEDEIGLVSLRRRIVDIPILGKEDQVVFILEDKNGKAINVDVFKKYFPTKVSKVFDLRGKYVPDAVVVAGDANFYKSPRTLGTIPNYDIFNIYKEKSGKSIILTARETADGMTEGIESKIIEAGGPLPIATFTKPPGASGGKYKGHVIGRIASQESVTSVTFYDDNLRYILGTKDVLKEEYSEEIINKVKIVKVDVSAKPVSMRPEEQGKI